MDLDSATTLLAKEKVEAAIGKVSEKLTESCKRAETVVSGAEELMPLILSGVIGKGHLLLEGSPGTGKTLLAKVVCRLLGLEMQRVQCTPDLLPKHIIGSVIGQFDREGKVCGFAFEQGPIFTNVLLADELNRSSPFTQSALLEAMEERKVTVNKESMPLPSFFTVLATQNPEESGGTFPLTEAQLDRFDFKLSIPYPDEEVMRKILRGTGHEEVNRLRGLFETPEEAGKFLKMVHGLTRLIVFPDDVERALIELCYGLERVDKVTERPSPRAIKSLYIMMRALALVRGKTVVSLQELRDLAVPSLAHRTKWEFDSTSTEESQRNAVEQFVEETVGT